MVGRMFRTPDVAEWKNRFTDAGLSASLFDALAKTKLISDYRFLHENYLRLKPEFKNEIQTVWQLICLSGDKTAFAKAVKQKIINKECEHEGATPLHYAALSGQPQQLSQAMKLELPFNAITKRNNSILQYAIMSHESDQVYSVFMLEKTQGKLPRYGEDNRNPLHLAAWTGNLDVVKLILAVAHLKETDGHGYNALDYAVMSNNQRVIKTLENLGLQPSGKNLEDFPSLKSTHECVIVP